MQFLSPKDKGKHGRKAKDNLHVHNDWEEDFLYTKVKDKFVCLICGVIVSMAKLAQYGETTSQKLPCNCPPGSALWAEKACEVKAAVFFHEAGEKVTKTTEA